MNPIVISSCIATDKIDESREFYVRYFDAHISFDCGWYLILEFGSKTSQLSFIDSRKLPSGKCNPEGLTYNFLVEDVDAEYRKLTQAGLIPSEPIEDHPWGDRSFAVKDPNGITLGIYSDREPSEEFRQYFR
ncbi:MAG: VOC family protein [Bacteroidota bacterium]